MFKPPPQQCENIQSTSKKWRVLFSEGVIFVSFFFSCRPFGCYHFQRSSRFQLRPPCILGILCLSFLGWILARTFISFNQMCISQRCHVVFHYNSNMLGQLPLHNDYVSRYLYLPWKFTMVHLKNHIIEVWNILFQTSIFDPKNACFWFTKRPWWWSMWRRMVIPRGVVKLGRGC